MNADVDKASELRDVRDDTWQHHSYLQVFYLVNGIIELEGFCLTTRVAPRLLQLTNDVSQRWHTHISIHIAMQVDLFLSFLVLNELGYAAPGVLCHLFNQSITFWMYGRVIQRVTCTWDAQESSTLFEG